MHAEDARSSEVSPAQHRHPPHRKSLAVTPVLKGAACILQIHAVSTHLMQESQVSLVT